MAIKFVDVKYKDVFENLNFQINKNEITSVVGKNSSGKTLLLNLIFGLDKTFEGKINIGKKVICKNIKYKKVEEIRFNISYMMQECDKQLFNLTIFEDIKYGIDTININKLEELLNIFGLNEEILKKRYFEISTSEKKKILIIKSFLRDSKILLFDDPTNGLDEKSISSLIKLLKKEKRKDKIIVLTSQDSDFLLKASDKILSIDNKKIIVNENKYEFFSNELSLENYGLNVPDVLEFRQKVLNKKDIKLVYRDNTNDLLKDIYRNVK